MSDNIWCNKVFTSCIPIIFYNSYCSKTQHGSSTIILTKLTNYFVGTISYYF